jgi:hypothetical protein
VMAWSRERESPTLKAFLDLVRAYGNWPQMKARREQS